MPQEPFDSIQSGSSNYAPVAEGDGPGVGSDEQSIQEVVAAEDGPRNEAGQGERVLGETSSAGTDRPPQSGNSKDGSGSIPSQRNDGSDQSSGHRRVRRIKREEAAAAMRAADGDFDLAAAAMERDTRALRVFVARDPQLAALWLERGKFDTPMEGETFPSRESEPQEIIPRASAGEITEQMLKLNRETLRGALLSAGISSETIGKLSKFEDMSANTGAFIAAAMDISHKIALYSSIALFEEAEKIKKIHLSDETLPMEYRIEWAKVYTDMCEMQGKTSDRMLAATQAVLSMMKKKEEQDEGAKKGKPGFSPLTKAKAVLPL